VLRGGGANTDVRYRVLRDGTLRVGDDGVLALTDERTDLTSSLGGLLAGSDQQIAARLARYGIAYVYGAPPVSPAVSGALDAAGGFTGASAPVKDSRAWRVAGPATLDAVDVQGNPVHYAALVVQVIAIIAAIVLALPSRRRR
jgi:hypothetical protein